MTMAAMGPYLLSELIIEILLRLPVKSLLRFKCVSKQWRCLISDSQFTTLHLNLNRSKKKETRPPSLVFIIHDLTSIFYTIARQDHKNSPFKVSDSKINLSGFRPAISFFGFGSGNEILCFSLSDRFHPDPPIYLMNPATGELKELPCFPVPDDHLSFLVGFGFEPVSRDYKVVKVVHYCDKSLQGRNPRTSFSVYSLKSNNWRTVEDIPGPETKVVSYFSAAAARSVIVINGVVQWMLLSGKIYSFDLVHEVHRELPSLPVSRNYIDLFEMGGSQLSVFCYDPQERSSQVEMWVMKEIGVEKTWTKHATIHLRYHSGLPRCHWEYTPVTAPWNDDDEILFQHYSVKLVLYNIKNNTQRELEVHGLPTALFTAVSLTEGLVKLS